MIRKAAVAGSFYPFKKERLVESIKKSFTDPEFGPGLLKINKNNTAQRIILGGVCPHAGYVYSGPAASNTIKAIFEEKCPDTVIILGTQHTGYRGIAIMNDGAWETPLGRIKIDSDLADSLANCSQFIKIDEQAFTGYHGREHNIEVQLPFLQYAANLYEKEIQIVTIKVGDMNLTHLEEVGKNIGTLISKQEKDIAIISSSDMTHKQPRNVYQPADDLKSMYESDKAVFEAINRYNWHDAFNYAKKTSVCGPQTIVTSMIICQELGATKASILKYYSSYEKMGGKGPCEYSVGYLSAVFSR